MVSIYDLAQRAGVAPSTVSKALRDDPRISAATRARIRALADETGFTPNTAAQSLTTHRTMTIGLVVRDYADPYNGILLRAIEATAIRAGYQLIVASTQEADMRDVDLARQLRRRRVDGMIIVASHFTENQALADDNVPVVFVAEKPELLPKGENVGLVTFDESAASRSATQHLIGLGHRRIGYVGLRRAGASSQDRQRGYEMALEASGIEVDPRLVALPTRLEPFQAGSEGVELLLRHDPSAIVFYNDLEAIGALRTLSDRGIKVPDDLSVVGFDDLEVSAFVTPPLTTMYQPREDMGRLATEQLLKIIAGDVTDRRADTACTLVVRRSTAAPRAGRSDLPL